MTASAPSRPRLHSRHRLSTRECRAWLARHDEGRLDYCTGRGPRSLVVRYAVRNDAVLLRLPTYNDLLQYAPGEEVALEVEAQLSEDEYEAVVVVGTAALVDDADVAVLTEDWPDGLPSQVLRVPIEHIDGFLDD